MTQTRLTLRQAAWPENPDAFRLASYILALSYVGNNGYNIYDELAALQASIATQQAQPNSRTEQNRSTARAHIAAV